MQNRRQFLFSAAAATAVAAAVSPEVVFAATAPTSDPAQAARATAIYDSLVARQLRRSPETATGLGIDSGDMAWTKSQLSDFSLVSLKETARFNAEELVSLRTVDRSKLAGMDAASYDTVEFVLANGEAYNEKFAFNGAKFVRPNFALSADSSSRPETSACRSCFARLALMEASSFAFMVMPESAASMSIETFGMLRAVAVPSIEAICSLASRLRCGPLICAEILTSEPDALADVTSTFGAENSNAIVSWS